MSLRLCSKPEADIGSEKNLKAFRIARKSLAIALSSHLLRHRACEKSSSRSQEAKEKVKSINLVKSRSTPMDKEADVG